MTNNNFTMEREEFCNYFTVKERDLIEDAFFEEPCNLISFLLYRDDEDFVIIKKDTGRYRLPWICWYKHFGRALHMEGYNSYEEFDEAMKELIEELKGEKHYEN